MLQLVKHDLINVYQYVDVASRFSYLYYLQIVVKERYFSIQE